MGCACSSEADVPINPDQVDLSHFTMLKVVGRGGFGKVNAVEKRDTKELMALKRIRKRLILEKDVYLETVWRERNVMTLWKTEYLVKIKYAFQDKDSLFLAMPFMPGGDLRYYLTTKGAMSEEMVRFYGAEMVLALEDMHKNHVVYRDLKPDNMLFDANGHIAFSDFGLAVVLEEKDEYKVRGSAGTPGYLAPEILKHEKYGLAVDRYSLGITLFELLEKHRPYETKRDAMQGAPAKFHTNVSAECKSFIRGLLNKRPAERLGSGPTGFAEIKAHPWFASVDWEAMSSHRIEAPFKPDTERANCSADFELEDQFFANADDTADPLTDEQQALFRGFEWNTEIKREPAEAAGDEAEAGGGATAEAAADGTAGTAAGAKAADATGAADSAAQQSSDAPAQDQAAPAGGADGAAPDTSGTVSNDEKAPADAGAAEAQGGAVAASA